MKKLSEHILEEGAWGYDPQDNDSVLDTRGDINLKFLEMIYDECFKMVYSNTEGITIDGNSMWDAIGTIEYFFEKSTILSDIYNKDTDAEYEKYYYWWKLKQDKQKDIIDLYSDALSQLSRNEEFIKSWKEPEKMKKSLLQRSEKLKKYAELRDAYFKKQLDNESERIKDTINVVEDPNISTPEKQEEVIVGEGQ